jgi:hypothetical protein
MEKKAAYMKTYYQNNKEKFAANTRAHQNRMKAKLLEAERLLEEYKKRAADTEAFQQA